MISWSPDLCYFAYTLQHNHVQFIYINVGCKWKDVSRCWLGSFRRNNVKFDLCVSWIDFTMPQLKLFENIKMEEGNRAWNMVYTACPHTGQELKVLLHQPLEYRGYECALLYLALLSFNGVSLLHLGVCFSSKFSKLWVRYHLKKSLYGAVRIFSHHLLNSAV